MQRKEEEPSFSQPEDMVRRLLDQKIKKQELRCEEKWQYFAKENNKTALNRSLKGRKHDENQKSDGKRTSKFSRDSYRSSKGDGKGANGKEPKSISPSDQRDQTPIVKERSVNKTQNQTNMQQTPWENIEKLGCISRRTELPREPTDGSTDMRRHILKKNNQKHSRNYLTTRFCRNAERTFGQRTQRSAVGKYSRKVPRRP